MREIVGASVANEMLFANRKLTAEAALRRGLVSEVFKTAAEAHRHAVETARHMLSFPLADKSLVLFKSLVRSPERIALMERVFGKEMDHLTQRMADGDVAEAAIAFLASKQSAKL